MEPNVDSGKVEVIAPGLSAVQLEIRGKLLALTTRMSSLERDYHDAVRTGDTKSVDSILELKRGGYREIWKLRKEAAKENQRHQRG